MQIKVQCSNKFFPPQEAGSFENNIEKKPQKPRPKLKKYVCYILTEQICSAWSPIEVIGF